MSPLPTLAIHISPRVLISLPIPANTAISDKILRAVNVIADEINLHEMPLFAILKHYPYYMMIVMIFLLWIAIFTTAAAGIFGLVTRIKTYVNSPAWLITLFLVIIMAPLTIFGFSNLISVLYPLYGLLNLYVFSAILLYPIVRRSESQRL